MDPEYKLYSPGQIFAASFLGTPLCGMLLAASNERNLGKRREAIWFALGGLAVEALLIVVALASSEHGPSGALHTGVSVGLLQWARTHKGVYQAHLAAGGQRASNGRVALNILVNLVIVVGLVALLYKPWGDAVVFGRSKVYYVPPVDGETARRVGQALKEADFFSDDQETEVQLKQTLDGYTLAFAVNEKALAERGLQEAFHELGDLVSVEALGSRPVEVLLCRSDFDKADQVLPPGPERHVLRVNDSRVYWMDGASEADAKKLVDAVAPLAVFEAGTGWRVQLHHRQERYQLDALVTEDGAFSEKTERAFRAVAELASRALGAPVDVRLCGPAWSDARRTLTMEAR